MKIYNPSFPLWLYECTQWCPFSARSIKKGKTIIAPILPKSYNLFHYLERSFLGENHVSDAVPNEVGSFPHPSCCNTFLLFGPTSSSCLFKKFQKQLTSKTHTHNFTCHLTSRLKVLSGWTTAAGYFYFLYHSAQVWVGVMAAALSPPSSTVAGYTGAHSPSLAWHSLWYSSHLVLYTNK